MSASVLAEFPPLLKGTAVVIGGGGAAALVPAELGGPTATSLLAIALPLVAWFAVGVFFVALYELARRMRRSTRTTARR